MISPKFLSNGIALFCTLVLFSLYHIATRYTEDVGGSSHEAQFHNGRNITSASVIQHECAVPQKNISNIFLHVGPIKTGTTSLQNYFTCESSFLEEHNTYFLGKINPRMSVIQECEDRPNKDYVRGIATNRDIRNMKRLKYKIESSVPLKRNLIMSAEEFGITEVQDLLEILFNKLDKNLEYNMVPVAAYRWYYDLLRSAYQFFYQYKDYQKYYWGSWDQPPIDQIQGTLNATLNSESIPTFRVFFKLFQNKTHPTIQLINTFKELFARSDRSINTPCFKILHINYDLIQQFLSLINGDKGNSSSPVAKIANKASVKPFIVDSEILALKLKDDGFIHKKYDRRNTAEILQQNMELLYGNITSMTPALLDCLSQEEEQELLRMTLQSDEILLNSGFMEAPLEGQDIIIKSFQKDVADKKFCNVLLEEMIKEEAWRRVILMDFKKGTAKYFHNKTNLELYRKRVKRKAI